MYVTRESVYIEVSKDLSGVSRLSLAWRRNTRRSDVDVLLIFRLGI